VQARPAWLKLTRVGTTVTGSVSNDGQVWAVLASMSVTGLTSTGLIVTSGDPAVRNVSTFDNVTKSNGTGQASTAQPAPGSSASSGQP
jgi:predicted ATP-grasp superfamily ATP-dependent carboligase